MHENRETSLLLVEYGGPVREGEAEAEDRRESAASSCQVRRILLKDGSRTLTGAAAYVLYCVIHG
jgi:hypothetical protein